MTREQFIGELDNWCSHRPALWDALQITDGKVIELGAGLGSTPLLERYCGYTGRLFESYENNLEWLRTEFDSRLYTNLFYIDNWDSVNLECSLLFVDSAPGERRKIDIARAANIAQVIVAHDTELAADHGYQMRDVLKTFKYMKDYETSGAWTTVVSNFIDVTKF
jgi:hypothetical protein